MKIGKLSVARANGRLRWQWETNEINPPHVIAWRFVFLNLMLIFLSFATLCVLIGWGRETAKDFWSNAQL